MSIAYREALADVLRRDLVCQRLKRCGNLHRWRQELAEIHTAHCKGNYGVHIWAISVDTRNFNDIYN